MAMCFRQCALIALLLLACAAAQAPEAYSREQLQPLTSFRQHHRRTVDGRLCAAAFVQDRVAYTGCTDSANPEGVAGREWCYVEAQLLSPSLAAWGFCAPAADYDAARAKAASAFAGKVIDVRALVSKLQKTQRAAEKALDLYVSKCSPRR
jgi:hypothetical protein